MANNENKSSILSLEGYYREGKYDEAYIKQK